MSQIKPASGPAFVGKVSGNTPNLFWRRLSSDQLRAQSQYVGLPPPEQLHFETTAGYRAVRQESQLWSQLHQGLLTTGKLNAALGFYEPAAAKRLGIPRDRVNHNSLLSAAANLQMPSYGLQALDLPATPVTTVQATTSITAPTARGLQNAITVSEYEAAAIKLANASLADAGSHRRRRPHKPHQQQQQAVASTTAAAVANGAVVHATLAQADSSVDPYASADARRKRCTGVATRGEGEIRMAWGSTQEASALFSVMHLFPDSQLEEVGLCWVDPKTQIPPEWGFRTEDLPPLGASPDGLIRHRAKAPPLPPTALPSPNGLLHKQASHRDMSHNRHMPLNQAPASNAEASTQAQPASSSGRSQEAFSSATQNSSAQSQSSATHSTVSTPRAALCASAQPNDPSLSEFESLPAKLEISSNNLTDRASNRSAHSNGVVASVAAGPPLSSDAGVPSASAAPAPQVAHGPSASAADALSASATAATEPNRATPPEQAKNQEEWLEAVEIKNVCPFREVREVSSNGKARRLYRLSDPGPYTRVPCHFVPQLQMEMLASGANSALVVSRSATKGVRVFRMQRHAEFLRQMLHTISQMHTKFVRCNRLPPPNMFFEQAAYQQFLRTTQFVAESVEIVIDVETQALPNVQDCRFFL